jgi:hypothetical protein
VKLSGRKWRNPLRIRKKEKIVSPRNFILPLSIFLALSPAAEGGGARPAKNPVLVELFTSQGCSSCPPAEAWLTGEGMELFQKGQIIPLAFHVDYWDYLGWKDPFSQAAFTARQGEYGKILGGDSLYTPEMVVGGKVGFVGSDGERARREIVKAQGWPAAFLSLHLTAGMDPKGIHLKVTLLGPKPFVKLWAAVFTNDEVTEVERGENRGRTLKENFVVRKLVELKPDSQGGALVPYTGSDGKTTGVAVFAQDTGTMEILAAQCRYPL